jgi:hypothetical protein
VSDHLSGTASGINNALTRVSNVFANAIFGALAVLFFAGALQDKVSNLPLDPKQKHEIVASAAELGNAKVPESISGQDKTKIEKIYHEGFIYAYGNIMRLSAGLAFLGAAMAVIFIKNKKTS